ncbi:hypothetical protein Dimus_015891 [Dionaea muscipula]
MATNPAVRSSLLRSLLRRRVFSSPVRAFSISLNSGPKATPSSQPTTPFSPFTASAASFLFSRNPFHSRNFSSDPDSHIPENIVVIKCEEDLNNAFRKAEDESSQVILYFTAEWCGPCRFLWPSLKGMSKDLSHVTVYKIDIDQEGIGQSLSKLNINSVPTLHFFANGKRVAEVIGADVGKIKNNAYRFYAKES